MTITSKYIHHYPHNVLKYCPKCGTRGFAPGDPATFLADENPSNQMKCRNPDCGFELYINAGTATAAIIHVDPETLLVARRLKEPHINTLDLPGGFVDPRETAEDAVRREVREEFNLTITNLHRYKHSYWNEYDFGGMVNFTLDLVYICDVKDWSDFEISEHEDVDRVDVKVKDIKIEAFGLDSIKRIIRDYKEDFLKGKIYI